jgi:hypothetical protein
MLDFQENNLLMDKTINLAKNVLKENIKPNDVDSKKIEDIYPLTVVNMRFCRKVIIFNT